MPTSSGSAGLWILNSSGRFASASFVSLKRISEPWMTPSPAGELGLGRTVFGASSCGS